MEIINVVYKGLKAVCFAAKWVVSYDASLAPLTDMLRELGAKIP